MDVENDEQYEALRDEGTSKERAERIANSPAATERDVEQSHSADDSRGVPGRKRDGEQGLA